VDPTGAPIAGETVKVSKDGKSAGDEKTDGDGAVDMAVDAGAYDVEVRGEKFKAYTLFLADQKQYHAVYEFVLAAKPDSAQGADDHAAPPATTTQSSAPRQARDDLPELLA
jgi:hypothetical protein